MELEQLRRILKLITVMLNPRTYSYSLIPNKFYAQQQACKIIHGNGRNNAYP